MDEKIYTNEVIQDNPFPNYEMVSQGVSESESDGVYKNSSTGEKTFPKKRSAIELLSSALNTRSKKILQEFELTQSGGIKVGDFKEGESGDLRITPNGLTARDINGITTIAIDGTTGDVIVKGIIQSGSVITGKVIVGDNRLIMDVDDAGHGTITINDGENDRVLIGYGKGLF